MYYYVCCPVCNQGLSAFVDRTTPGRYSCLPTMQNFPEASVGTEWSNDFGRRLYISGLKRKRQINIAIYSKFH